jgi:hypothetical protein
MDDAELWAGFTSHSLSESEWTHRAHVRTAFAFLQRNPLDEAHVLMRVGIIRLNERHGLVETAARGYFETMTRVWLVLVADARQRTAADSSEALLAAAPELLDRALPLRHYSQSRLAGPKARAIFLPPDLAPLPYVE